MRRNVTLGLTFALSVAMLLVSSATAVYAGNPTVPAPEIDSASIFAGLGLLGAGVMVLRARRRSK
jgi:MYXO-CTERM domain-containing protein